jgi:hypothetical protein
VNEIQRPAKRQSTPYHPETLTNTPYHRERCCTLQKVYIFLVILVVRVRKYVGTPPWRRPNAQNKFKYGTFSLISQFIQIFYICWYLWKALNEIKMFEIRKVLSGSLFIWKIFEMKFWSLHHFGIWVKRQVKSCQMSGRSFVEVRWYFGSDFLDLQLSCSDRLSWSTSANVRSGQPCVCAFCSWHEIGTARL